MRERPLITRASRSRATRSSHTEDLEAALKVRPHTILDTEKMRHGIADAKKLYEEKGYLDADDHAEDRARRGRPNEVTLTYVVDEGKIVRIQDDRDRGQQRVQRPQAEAAS